MRLNNSIKGKTNANTIMSTGTNTRMSLSSTFTKPKHHTIIPTRVVNERGHAANGINPIRIYSLIEL